MILEEVFNQYPQINIFTIVDNYTKDKNQSYVIDRRKDDNFIKALKEKGVMNQEVCDFDFHLEGMGMATVYIC